MKYDGIELKEFKNVLAEEQKNSNWCNIAASNEYSAVPAGHVIRFCHPIRSLVWNLGKTEPCVKSVAGFMNSAIKGQTVAVDTDGNEYDSWITLYKYIGHGIYNLVIATEAQLSVSAIDSSPPATRFDCPGIIRDGDKIYESRHCGGRKPMKFVLKTDKENQ